MEYKTVYIAEDGKRFDNSKECSEYEAELKNGKYAFEMYKVYEKNLGSKRYNCCKMHKNLENIRECDAIKICTDEAAYIIDNYCKEHSIISPFDNNEKLHPGTFYYEIKDGKWVDLNKKVEEIASQFDKLLSIKIAEKQGWYNEKHK